MFGLPIETFLLVFGFPVLWIIYTLVFMRRSRDWDDETADRDEAS
jgi:hypothetical protein